MHHSFVYILVIIFQYTLRKNIIIKDDILYRITKRQTLLWLDITYLSLFSNILKINLKIERTMAIWSYNWRLEFDLLCIYLNSCIHIYQISWSIKTFSIRIDWYRTALFRIYCWRFQCFIFYKLARL